MTKLIPAKGYAILRPLTTQKTDTGLDVGAPDKDMPQIGVIYKLGKPDKEGYPVENMKEGDTCIYQKYMTNKTYIAELALDLDFIKFENICAIIPKEEK